MNHGTVGNEVKSKEQMATLECGMQPQTSGNADVA